jgi:hypothetical protein
MIHSYRAGLGHGDGEADSITIFKGLVQAHE